MTNIQDRAELLLTSSRLGSVAALLKKISASEKPEDYDLPNLPIVRDLWARVDPDSKYYDSNKGTTLITYPLRAEYFRKLISMRPLPDGEFRDRVYEILEDPFNPNLDPLEIARTSEVLECIADRFLSRFRNSRSELGLSPQ
jgi:hypothetical protein